MKIEAAEALRDLATQRSAFGEATRWQMLIEKMEAEAEANVREA